MSEQTPGQGWRYEEGTKTIREVLSDQWIATMDSWDGAQDHTANARLISAAPELLSAAQAVANPDIPSELAADMCRAAIAKATEG
jgi:hypothetical protein